jgi:hypothetical protein
LKYLAIHIHEPAQQRTRDLVNTPAFVNAQRQRKKVEALFAELSNIFNFSSGLLVRNMSCVRNFSFRLSFSKPSLKISVNSSSGFLN